MRYQRTLAAIATGALLSGAPGLLGCGSNPEISGDSFSPPAGEAPQRPSEGMTPAGHFEGETDLGTCAEVAAAYHDQVPTVMLLLDQSGSMTSAWDGTTRWNAMYEALMLPDGIVARVQENVSFGMAMYTSYNGGETCPVLTEVAPALANHAAIDSVFAAVAPQDDTPTGEDLEAVTPILLAAPQGPRLILLATDGEPDSCEVPDPQTGHERALAGAQFAADAGAKVVVLAVGQDLSEGHQQEMANVGAGLAIDAVNPAPFYRPQTQDQLVSDMEEVIRGARYCQIPLEGEIDEALAADGYVTLNGQELTYGDADGWKLNSPHEIELVGAACEQVMAGGDDVVAGTFPCSYTPELLW
jgi:hypothetical protein